MEPKHRSVFMSRMGGNGVWIDTMHVNRAGRPEACTRRRLLDKTSYWGTVSGRNVDMDHPAKKLGKRK